MGERGGIEGGINTAEERAPPRLCCFHDNRCISSLRTLDISMLMVRERERESCLQG